MKRLLLAGLFGSVVLVGAAPAHAVPSPNPQDLPSPADREAERRAADIEGDDIKTSGPGKEADAEVEDPSRHFNFFNMSFHGKDELGGPFGDGVMVDPETHKVDHDEEPMSAPFIFMLINFAILLVILSKYGGPAAKKLAEERHDAIKSALDEAARLRAEAAAKLKEYEVRLKDSDAEIKKLVDGMRADAEAEKVRILAAADAQAATMKREAEARIAAEIQLARATLTREVTAAAAAATEKILRERLTADDQNRLVTSFLTDMQHVAPTSATSKEPV